MKKLIVLSDVVTDPLYKQELRSTVEGFLQGQDYPFISFVATHSSTISSGFMLSQIVQTEEFYGRPLNTVCLVNNGIHDAEFYKGMALELDVLRIKSGMYICGFDIGYNFSFIKHDIEEMYSYKMLEENENPLRSDLCLRMCSHLMNAMQDEMELEEKSTNSIQETTRYFVARTNNFEEILTTLTKQKLDEKYHIGDMIPLTINGEVQNLRFTEKADLSGELLLYPYSADVKYNPYLVISGWKKKVDVGNEIIVT